MDDGKFRGYVGLRRLEADAFVPRLGAEQHHLDVVVVEGVERHVDRRLAARLAFDDDLAAGRLAVDVQRRVGRLSVTSSLPGTSTGCVTVA